MPMCHTWTWVKAEVITCHHAPLATPACHAPPTMAQRVAVVAPGNHWVGSVALRQKPPGCSASRLAMASPPIRISAQTATLMPISTMVVRRGFVLRVPPKGPSCCRVCFAKVATHSGHWNPTAALIMQSPQIGRPQRWQRM